MIFFQAHMSGLFENSQLIQILTNIFCNFWGSGPTASALIVMV